MNDLVHYAAGVAIASACGFRGRRRFALGLFAIAPDWDVITTPLIPFLIDRFDLDHEAGHTLIIALGHGAFSHSLIATAAIIAIGWMSRLRGRSLAAAGASVASHYPLDFVLTWSVWPFLPFSDQGLAWGVVTTGDPVVTTISALILVAFLAPDIRAWWRRRRGRLPARTLPAWAGIAAMLVMAASITLPALLQTHMLREHARSPDSVADPVSYTRHAIITHEGENVHLLLVDARHGIIGEMTRPRETDGLDGGGQAALATIRRALEDADAPSPLVRPLLVARHGASPGEIVVEAREASTVVAAEFLAHEPIGFDFTFDEEGNVAAVHARKGDRSTRIPPESLPTFVPISTR